MYTLGLVGGIDLPNEPFYYSTTWRHDSAAVLLKDGKIVAAVENERLTRNKHCNAFAGDAIDFCMSQAGITIDDVDRIGYYWRDTDANAELFRICVSKRLPTATMQDVLSLRFKERFGSDVLSKLEFVPHHLCHTLSAVAYCERQPALVVTIDGAGETDSGMISRFVDGKLEKIADVSEADSMGLWYMRMISILSYGFFDEYKVMGLAPYGDPSVYRSVVQSTYSLEDNGRVRMAEWNADAPLKRKGDLDIIDWAAADAMPAILSARRIRGQKFETCHNDWAASVQEGLEEMAFHMFKHYSETTGLRNLAIAGGVAHNCTFNGKLVDSGLFDHVFIQPVSHDAGCALGAALSVGLGEDGKLTPQPMPHLFWGPDLPETTDLRQRLAGWADLVTISEPDDIIATTADLLADGKVIGWVQGRSEFGPRALGNRSILADPRPQENKARINQMVKKREGYRPFAPSVLEEHVDEFFDLAKDASFGSYPYMVIVVPVREDKRELLGAVSHVDGSARVQTVGKDHNSRYYDLIRAFGDRTGVPIVLNTSFNNNVEPIVDSAEDALTCYLTTGLDHLVVGDFVISKRDDFRAKLGNFKIRLCDSARMLHSVTTEKEGGTTGSEYLVESTFSEKVSHQISKSLFDALLLATSDQQTAEQALEHNDVQADNRQPILDELFELWSKRLVALAPLA